MELNEVKEWFEEMQKKADTLSIEKEELRKELQKVREEESSIKLEQNEANNR